MEVDDIVTAVFCLMFVYMCVTLRTKNDVLLLFLRV